MKQRFWKFICDFFIALVLITGCQSPYTQTSNQAPKDTLTLACPGSIILPFQDVLDSFEHQHPTIKVIPNRYEDTGNLHFPVRFSEDLLIAFAQKIQDTSAVFAFDEMVLAYSNRSKYFNAIQEKSWIEILEKPEVVVAPIAYGQIPEGFQTEACMKLCEMYYKKPHFSQWIANKNLYYTRPSVAHMISLLKSHAIDYTFLYRSIAQHYQLSFLPLRGSINLHLAEFCLNYQEVFPGSHANLNRILLSYQVFGQKTSNHKNSISSLITFLKNRAAGILCNENYQNKPLPELDLN